MRHAFTLIELMIVIAIIAIIAAIAIPNLLESRVTANESAAATSLKSGVFPAEVQFQGGACQDSDTDNVGEYGHLVDLGGNRATTGTGTTSATGQLHLLQGPLALPAETLLIGATSTIALRVASGYNFEVITDNGTGAAVLREAQPLAAAAGAPLAFTEQAPERNWMCFAAPLKYNDTGRRVFNISHEGQVRSPTAQANTATWFAANRDSTPGSFLAGEADAMNTVTDVSAGFKLVYPFYSK